MTWARIDDRMPDNRKILAVPPATRWALIELWCYCAGQESDGHVPLEAASRRANKKQLEQMVAAGLIHRNGTGWVVNDWLEYNISAADAKKKREDASERKRKWRETHRSDDGTFE